MAVGPSTVSMGCELANSDPGGPMDHLLYVAFIYLFIFSDIASWLGATSHIMCQEHQ